MESRDQNSKHHKAGFVEPYPHGYIYVGMKADPPGRVPLVRGSVKREERIEHCRTTVEEIEHLDEVVRATVYRAVLIPPVKGSPRFDVAVLFTTDSPESAERIRSSEAFQDLEADFVMSARNVRRIGDTDETSTGTFLFNHFTAPEAGGAIRAFEEIAGWYREEIGIDNSTLLQPVERSPYVFVNYVRLPTGPRRFMLDQFTKPSFYSEVRSRLRDNGMTAMPILYEPVR